MVSIFARDGGSMLASSRGNQEHRSEMVDFLRHMGLIFYFVWGRWNTTQQMLFMKK